MEDFAKKLNFESDTFADMKRDMDHVLQRLLATMWEKGSTEGSMALKIDVRLTTGFIPNYDPSVEGESRMIHTPRFSHKVTSAVQIKDEKKGNMDTEMELVFDEDSGEYVMKPVVNTEQRSIFDSDFEDNMAGESWPEDPDGEEEDNHSGGIPQLPGPTGGDIIDGEYTEADESEENSEPAGDQDGEDDAEDGFEDITDELMGSSSAVEDSDDDLDGYDYEDPEDE